MSVHINCLKKYAYHEYESRTSTHQTDSIVDPFVVGESAVSTLVCDDPDTSGVSSLHSSDMSMHLASTSVHHVQIWCEWWSNASSLHVSTHHVQLDSCTNRHLPPKLENN